MSDQWVIMQEDASYVTVVNEKSLAGAMLINEATVMTKEQAMDVIKAFDLVAILVQVEVLRVVKIII
jgi:hypothetical protein